jgi:hypothetical protein
MGEAVKALLLGAAAFAAGAVVGAVGIGAAALISISSHASEGASFYEMLDDWWDDDLFEPHGD